MLLCATILTSEVLCITGRERLPRLCVILPMWSLAVRSCISSKMASSGSLLCPLLFCWYGSLLCLLLCCWYVDETLGTNPGLKIRLSQRGLDYGARVAVQSLAGKVRSASLPDYSGKRGNRECKATNMKVGGELLNTRTYFKVTIINSSFISRGNAWERRSSC